MTPAPTRPRPHGDAHGLDSIAAFAYLRRLPAMDRTAVQRSVAELEALAAERGFRLAGVHFERRPGERLDTWMELILGCRAEGIVNVLVPSAEHFHRDPAVAAFMREELAERIRGTVWLAAETGSHEH